MLTHTHINNQANAQKVLFDYIVEEARAQGVNDVRLSTNTVGTLYASTEQLGLVENEPGCPWLSYKGK